MGEHFGEVALFISIFVHTFTEEFVTVVAHMLTFHTYMLARHFHIALVTEQVTIFINTIADLLVADGAVMVVYLIVGAVDDHVATITVIVLVLVYMDANKFSAALSFVTKAVVVIVEAYGRNPYTAPITDVKFDSVLVVGAVGIFLAFCFCAADIADSIFILIHVIVAL